MKMTLTDRILLALTGMLAGYQVAVGINGLGTVPITAYTIAFGVLLVASLLINILGFEALESPIVAIVSTVLPLALATGLVWEHLVAWQTTYILFALTGFAAVIVTRSLPMQKKVQTMVLAVVHGIAGMTIFLLPSVLAANGAMKPAFALVSLGGALIGIGGLLLSFLKAGKPIVPRQTILKLLPSLLLLMTAAFVAGFQYG
jgi:hypothetical protein